MSPMVRRSLTIEHALLGFLQQSPLHGYQLHQQVSDPAGLKLVWYVKQAQLYSLLGRLEEAGYITSSIQQQETRPARRVFQLTKAGLEAFQNWLYSPVSRPTANAPGIPGEAVFCTDRRRRGVQPPDCRTTPDLPAMVGEAEDIS